MELWSKEASFFTPSQQTIIRTVENCSEEVKKQSRAMSCQTDLQSYIYIYAYNYINQSANPGLGLHNPCVYNWYTYYMCESIKQSPKLILSLLSSKEVSISINFLKACTHPRPWFIIFVPRLLANFGANDFDLAPSAIKSRAKPTSLWLDGFLQDQAIFPKCLLSTILREFFMLSPPKRQRITKTWRCCWMHQRKATEVQVQW